MFEWLLNYFGYIYYKKLDYRFENCIRNMKTICYYCHEPTYLNVTKASLLNGVVHAHCPLCNRGIIMDLIENKK